MKKKRKEPMNEFHIFSKEQIIKAITRCHKDGYISDEALLSLKCAAQKERLKELENEVNKLTQSGYKEFAEEKDIQKRQLTEMSEDELDKENIFKFDSFDDFFDFIYDENTNKADIINDMSEQMKRQLLSENYSERYIETGGAFYYNPECFTMIYSGGVDQ